MTKVVDWLGIEVAYRADVKSLRQLAKDYGISEGAIRQQAKQCDWVRDGKIITREHVNALLAHEKNHVDAEKAEALADSLDHAAHDDMRDMQLSLRNARLILKIAHEVLTAIQADEPSKRLLMSNARNLKMLSEATRHSTEIIRQIRQLDTPVNNQTLKPDDKAILVRYVQAQQT